MIDPEIRATFCLLLVDVVKVSLHICSNEVFLTEAFVTFNICHSLEKSGSRGVTNYAVDYIVGGQGPLRTHSKGR